jgi:hypothetical protein
MANRLEKVPKTTYTPAVQAIPGRAAYCITEQRVGAYVDGGSIPANVPSGWSGISFSIVKPVIQTVQVCFPEIKGRPAVPARVDQFDNLGWNSGARSINPVPGDGVFRCTLPFSPVGVQVGFTARDMVHNYSGMRHSLVARRGLFTIVEAGVTVFGPSALPAAATIEIQRTNGAVTYRVNGVQVYTSGVPSVGDVYAGALLYSVSDYVDAPALFAVVAPISFRAYLSAMMAAVSDAESISEVRTRQPGLLLLSALNPVLGQIEFTADFPSMVAAISDVQTNLVRTALPQLGFRAELGLVEETPTSMIAVLPAITLSATLISGQSISFTAELPPMIAAISDVPVSWMRADIPVLFQVLIGEPYLLPDEVDGSDAAFMSDSSMLESALLLLAMDSLDLSSTEATLVIVVELAGFDSLDLQDSTSIGAIVELLAMEQVAIISRAATAKQQAIQYAVNYMTGALTTYRDFDFEGFTCDHDDAVAYGWRADGLYRIGGDRDSDKVINALVDFGASDYGDAHMKRLATAFVGVRTDGECYLRMADDDGVQQVYKLVGGGSQKRAVLAKGVASRYWNVRLELVSASFASVDNVELEVGVSQRRSFSRRN